MMEDTILEIHNLRKTYGNAEVLHGVDFSVRRGGIYGLVGPNGAGKTTIMKILGGLVYPTAGEMTYFDSSHTALDWLEARKRCSFMIETPYLKRFANARQNLEKQRLQKGIADKSIIEEVLEITGLQSVDPKKEVRQYSLGMKQRLGIANAIMCRPELMVLDEPVNGLDPEGIHEIRQLLLKQNRENSMTILISSHILSELSQLCTDYIFIGDGNILEKVTAEELSRNCTGHLEIGTNDNDQAFLLLQACLGEGNVQRSGELLRLYGDTEDVVSLSRTLFENGIIPIHIARQEKDLEKYYLENVLQHHDREGDI